MKEKGNIMEKLTDSEKEQLEAIEKNRKEMAGPPGLDVRKIVEKTIRDYWDVEFANEELRKFLQHLNDKIIIPLFGKRGKNISIVPACDTYDRKKGLRFMVVLPSEIDCESKENLRDIIINLANVWLFLKCPNHNRFKISDPQPILDVVAGGKKGRAILIGVTLKDSK